MTKIQITPAWKHVKPSGFYVYVHSRATDGTPFYVGRGTGNRGWQAYSGFRSAWWTNTAIKHGVIVDVCDSGLTTQDADLLEEWIIAKLRHEGNRLVNITDGGGGTVGWVPSREVRQKIGKAKSIRVECSDGICFFSMTDAAKYLEESGYGPVAQGSISTAVAGIRNTCCGMSWWACGDKAKEVITRSMSLSEKRGVKVIRSDGVSFESLSHAVNTLREEGHMSASAGSLHGGIGNGRIRYGYTWEYL